MKHPELLQRYVELVRSGPNGLFSTGDLARLEAHVEDALVAAPILSELQPDALVDIGSGGGIPGVPLAVEELAAHVHLVESLGWKAAFLTHAARELKLDQSLTVHLGRAEEALAAFGRESCDVGTARAVATPPVVAEYLAPLVRPGGTLLLWTTSAAAATHDLAPASAALGLGEPSVIPAASSLRANGVLLRWPKVAPTPARFPRRVGVAARKPL